MSVKIAINGFGRIGRMAFRKTIDDPDIQVVAINDLTSTEMLAYLLKYDSVQKRFEKEVSSGEGFISVDGVEIPVFSEADAEKLPW